MQQCRLDKYFFVKIMLKKCNDTVENKSKNAEKY